MYYLIKTITLNGFNSVLIEQVFIGLFPKNPRKSETNATIIVIIIPVIK